MHALLFGAGGQLGVDLARHCRERGHSVAALSRNECDISDTSDVRERIVRQKPDWVLNAAAYNQVDAAEDEPETAMRINASAVRAIALACARAGATLLHYSTDLVFSGDKRSPYTEEDPPSPLSTYGVSKLAGEFFVRAYCPSHYILRVAGVFGPPGRYTNRGNFPEFVLRQANEGAALRIVDDCLTTPTFGPALATRSLDVLEQEIPFGLYHLAGGQPVTWHDFAVKVARSAGCPARILRTKHRERQTPARRPQYSALSNARIETVGIGPMPNLDDCVREYLLQREREQPQRRPRL